LENKCTICTKQFKQRSGGVYSTIVCKTIRESPRSIKPKKKPKKNQPKQPAELVFKLKFEGCQTEGAGLHPELK